MNIEKNIISEIRSLRRHPFSPGYFYKSGYTTLTRLHKTLDLIDEYSFEQIGLKNFKTREGKGGK